LTLERPAIEQHFVGTPAEGTVLITLGCGNVGISTRLFPSP